MGMRDRARGWHSANGLTLVPDRRISTGARGGGGGSGLGDEEGDRGARSGNGGAIAHEGGNSEVVAPAVEGVGNHDGIAAGIAHTGDVRAEITKDRFDRLE